MRVLNTGSQDVTRITYLPDGRLALHLSDGGICVWDGGATWQVIAPAPEAVTVPAASPNGRWLAWCGGGGWVGVRRSNGAGTQHCLRPAPPQYPALWTCAFSPDGRTLAASGGGLHAWGVGDWQRLPAPREADDPGDDPDEWWPDDMRRSEYAGLAFAPGSATAAVASRSLRHWGAEWRLRLWDTAGGTLAPALPAWSAAPAGGKVGALAQSPDGSLLCGLAGADLAVWDARTGASLHRLAPSPAAKGRTPSGYACFALSPDGRLLAAGGPRRVALIDPTGGGTLAEYDWRFGDTLGLAFAPDGLTLAGCFSGRKVVVWDVED